MKNPRGLQLPKTLCTFLFLIFDVNNKKHKYTPRYLTEFVKSSTNCLQIINQHEKFDKDLFDHTLKLFPWYDLQTKLVLIDFFK